MRIMSVCAMQSYTEPIIVQELRIPELKTILSGRDVPQNKISTQMIPQSMIMGDLTQWFHVDV